MASENVYKLSLNLLCRKHVVHLYESTYVSSAVLENILITYIKFLVHFAVANTKSTVFVKLSSTFQIHFIIHTTEN